MGKNTHQVTSSFTVRQSKAADLKFEKLEPTSVLIILNNFQNKNQAIIKIIAH